MVSEEAREWLRSIKDNYIHGGDEAFDNARREALDMAIKALEQEPCEDCISRQAVEKITWEEPSYTDPFNVLTEVREKVRALPPVTPQPKTGWIPVSERPPETDDEVIAYDGADAFVAWYGVNGWHSTDNRFDPRVPIIEWKPINLPKAEEKTNDSCWKEYYESKFMKKV